MNPVLHQYPQQNKNVQNGKIQSNTSHKFRSTILNKILGHKFNSVNIINAIQIMDYYSDTTKEKYCKKKGNFMPTVSMNINEIVKQNLRRSFKVHQKHDKL